MKTKKLFQENSYITSSDAYVLSCTRKENFYEVILDKTIFYPHMSGGQPKDEGYINNIKVIDVFERDDEIIHIVNEPIEGNVNLEIDFNIRFDHMQQHSGQHLLSNAFWKLYQGKTVGFHLSGNYTTIDLNIYLTEHMIWQAEYYANQIIYANKNISFQLLNYDDAIKLGLRKAPPKLVNLRIMNIEGVEYTACGGTHVNKTGEIGIVKIIKVEKHKSGVRVEFLCGRRALEDYFNKNNRLIEIGNFLTCGESDIFDNIVKLKDENKNLKKDIAYLQKEINSYKAEELKNSAIIKNNIKYIIKLLNNTDIKDLRFICSKIIEEQDYLTILASENEGNCYLILGQSSNLNLDLMDVFQKCKEFIKAKGGGNKYLIQGTGKILKGNECIELCKNILLNN